MSQCKGRYADKECFFKNNKIYFTEKRCLGTSSCEDDLCKNCSAKSTIPFDSKDQKNLYQGKVGEPYFARSHLFGSPWFLKRNNLEEYVISNEDYRIAKEAQRIAIEGNQMPRKKKEDEGNKIKEVKPKQVKAKEGKDEKPKETKPKETKPKETKPKETKPRKKKEPVVASTTPAPTPAPVAVEVFEEPLEAFEVIKIPVISKTIQEKTVWYESKKNKVYEQKKDNGIGKYLGRYDSAEDKIVDFPDSDLDV